MSSADQVYVVLLVKVFDDDLAKCIRDTSVILTPVNYIFLRVSWIRPQQITEKSRVRDISWPKDLVDLLQVVQFRRQSTVDAKNFIIDNCCNWEAIKALDELFPELKGVPPLAFVVKPVNPVNGSTFVVPSKQEKVFWVLDFVSQEEANNLQVLLASIDVVSKEQIV